MPPQRRHMRRLRSVSVCVLLVLGVWFAATHLRYPTSASAPPGLYWLTSRTPSRGAWVVACLPESLAKLGRARRYLGVGDCPHHSSPVLKRLAALPGDTVRLSAAGLSINGTPLPDTERRRLDRRGRPVPSVPTGTYPVSCGEAWLYSNHSPASWDSRYYGPVPLAGVRGCACRLWPSPDCAIRTLLPHWLVHLDPS